jgi:hypothetical protein
MAWHFRLGGVWRQAEVVDELLIGFVNEMEGPDTILVKTV